MAQFTRQRRPRVTVENHLAWIRTLPCLITNSVRDIQAAHIRYADPRYGKRPTGMGEKASDMWAVPLAPDVHEEQHGEGERGFWAESGFDPLLVAAALWANTGDTDTAVVILRTHREAARRA